MTPRRRPGPGPAARLGLDVVAGFDGDGAIGPVAREAAREAAERATRVLFVAVVPASVPHARRRDVEMSVFGSILRALREFPGVPTAFEMVTGDAVAELVARSAGAGLLVVGDDRVSDVARRCARSAACEVRTVRTTAGGAHALASMG